MEGVAFPEECLEVCWDLGLTIEHCLGGGAAPRGWNPPMYNLPLRVSSEERAGLGAAIAAA